MADGSIIISTKIDQSGFNKGTKQLEGGLSSIKNSLKSLAIAAGVAFGTAAIVSFGKASVKSATNLTNAMTGLKSIMDGQGRSFAEAQGFIDSYTKDGLIPATDAITAYKNLASRGYDTKQIEQSMLALKDSSAFGRQASLSMGEAVRSASEGLKNENSILVDNAGVTKNVSMMWKDYANSIGVGVDSLTKQQKIQAEVLGIMEETKFQTGDAAKVANSFSGQILQLQFSFNNLKIAIGNAIMPIAQAVLPQINAMITGLTRLANVFAQVSTALFGKQAEQQSQVTSTAVSASKAQDNLAKSTTKASKAAKNSLASFDQLNVLQGNTSDGDTSSTADSGADTGIAAIDPLGGEIGGNIELSPKVMEVMDRVKSAFEPIKTSLENLRTALDPLKNFVAQGLQDFYDSFLQPVGSWIMGEGLPRFIDAISNGLENINWESINKSLDWLWEALTPFAVTVGEGLLWLWENVIVPFGTWVMSDVVPAFLDLLSAAIGTVTNIIKALKPMGKWLWDKLLKPLATWTGGLIVSILEGFTKALTGISDWISNNQTAFETIVIILGSIAAAIGLIAAAVAIAKGVMAAYTVVQWAVNAAMSANPIGLVVIAIAALIAIIVLCIKHWDDIKAVAVKVWDAIVGAVKAAVDGIKAAFNKVVDFFKDNWVAILLFIVNPFAGAFKLLYDNFEGFRNFVDGFVGAIKDFFVGLWDGIKNVFSAIGTWFSDKFTEAWDGIKAVFSGVGTFFSGIWDTIKSKFSSIGTSIGDTMGEAFKTVVNAILTFAEDKINGFINAINTAIGTINKIPGVSIETLGTLEIPKLARGGIVDSPTVAMIGEAGKEAVIPLENNTGALNMLASKILSGILPVLQSSGGSSSPQIYITLDGRELSYEVTKIQNGQRINSNGRG